MITELISILKFPATLFPSGNWNSLPHIVVNSQSPTNLQIISLASDNNLASQNSSTFSPLWLVPEQSTWPTKGQLESFFEICSMRAQRESILWGNKHKYVKLQLGDFELAERKLDLS